MSAAVKNKKLERGGFTLTETVVASALLLLAIVPILKALTAANLGAVQIEKKTQSLCLAQAKLNNLKARAIYNFDGLSSSSNENLGSGYLCSTTVSGSGYLRDVSISVGHDKNGSNILDSGEIECTLQSRLAKRQPGD